MKFGECVYPKKLKFSPYGTMTKGGMFTSGPGDIFIMHFGHGSCYGCDRNFFVFFSKNKCGDDENMVGVRGTNI